MDNTELRATVQRGTGTESRDHAMQIAHITNWVNIMEVAELFSRLRKEAECSICVHTVNQPKSLPCLHSFCLDCIDKYAATKRREGNTAFGCPECSAIVNIPDGDRFDNFPTSFYLNRFVDILALQDEAAGPKKCGSCDEDAFASSFCFDCKDFLCPACLAAHNRLKVTRGHRQASTNNFTAGDVQEFIQMPVMCEKPNHKQEPLEFFCRDCQACFCHKCSVTTHNQHVKVDITDAADQRKAEIIQSIQKIRDLITHNEQGMDKEREITESFQQQVKSSRDKVLATMAELYRILKEYETSFMERLDDWLTQRQEAHAAKQKNFELSLAQMTSAVDYMEAIIQRNIGAEILRSWTAITKRAEEIVLQENEIRSSKASRVDFEANEELCTILRHSAPGRLFGSCITDPSSSTAEGEGLHEAECGEIAEFTVTTKGADGELCYSQQDRVSVHIKTATGREVEADVNSDTDGRYHVTYTPTRHGESHVTIRVNGHVLPSSPWHVHVRPHQYQAISSLGTAGTGRGEFRCPCGVAVSSTGNVAVVDELNKRVQVFSSAGRYLGEFDGEGQPAAPQISKPDSVAYLGADHILVSDAPGIFLYKENGEPVKCLNTAHYQSPTGISVNRDGHVIVCDSKTRKVVVLSPDGDTLLQSFKAPGCHTEPRYAVQHEDKFFVSYPDSHCIKVFDAAGNFVQDIGHEGSGNGQLNWPLGVAVDKFNNLVVVDDWNDRLQIFTPEGEFVSAIGGEGTELGQFSSLEDVAVSRDGRLYVTDYSNNRVQILV